VCVIDYVGITTYRSNAFEHALVYVCEDVSFRVAEDLESDGTVMVLERRDIVVAYSEVGTRVDLVTVTIYKATFFNTNNPDSTAKSVLHNKVVAPL